MKNKKNFEKINHYLNKIQNIKDLYTKKVLEISFDSLKNSNSCENEILYFNCQNNETKGIFVFSYKSFLKELKDKEIKRYLGQNYLNIRIYNTYLKLKYQLKQNQKKLNKKVKINDIIYEILNQDTENKLYANKILQRILLLAYYHNWPLINNKDSIDTDYFIEIPNEFTKIKQRFNLDFYINLLDDKDFLVFINKKSDLIFVFKNENKLTKQLIQKQLFEYLKLEFGIEKIQICK